MPRIQREVLPIPDPPFTGLVTYDAKDPDTKFPPIEPLRPPEGAPNVLLVLLDDAGFGAMNTFGGPGTTPNADRLAAGGLTYNRVPCVRLVRADPAGVADWPQPSCSGDGDDHRGGDVRAGVHLDPAEDGGAAGGDPDAEWLLDGAHRQMSRGAVLAGEPDGTV
jgi:hypothetical protein